MNSTFPAAPTGATPSHPPASSVLSWTPLSVVFGCDLRTLALFRINLALLILLDLVLRSRDLVAHYTDSGVLPRADYLAQLDGMVASLHFIGGSALIQGLLFLLSALVALALLVGYRTRVVTLLSWLLLLSLENRNHLILQGGDMLLLLLLFWGMFLPLGARFSVDRALAKQEVPTDNRFFSAGTVALLIQCMCVYFFTALLKTSPVYIPDGTAVYYALQLDAFATPLGHLLSNFPLIMQGLTYFVWWLELIGPILIFLPIFFLPLRLITLGLLITMHVGFFLCLEIGLFPLISITSLLTFLPGAFWNWVDRKVERGGHEPIAVFYDGGCDFCRKICDLLRVFLILPGVVVKPAQNDPTAGPLMEEHNSWVVVDSAGAVHLRWNALTWLMSRSPLFWPLGRLLAALGDAGDRAYGWVAANRGRFSGITAHWLRYRDLVYEPTLGSNLVVVFFLALIIHGNLGTIGIRIEIPEVARSVYSTLRLYQNWNMFAPRPMIADTWLVPVATLRNGMVVDVSGETMVEPSFAKPASAKAFHPTYRWRKFVQNSVASKNEPYRAHYAGYLCRVWNERNVDEFHIAQLQIIAVEEPSVGFATSAHNRYIYWEGGCSEAAARERFDEAPGAL